MAFAEYKLQQLVNDVGTPLSTSVTFDGGTEDDPGDFEGAGNPHTLFTVTGLVMVKLFAVCGTSLEGASATLEVGTALSTAGLLAQTTATDIDANEIWHDASPDASIEAASVLAEQIVNQDIIQTVGTANITAGEVTYHCIWKPLSHGSTLAVAP